MQYSYKAEILGKNMYWQFYLFDYELLPIGKFITKSKSPLTHLYQEGRKMFSLDKGRCRRQRDLKTVKFLMK
jgi:hypothetical protein